ncbi:MAG: ABC transporter substrate-binding protein [Paracoccus sp. (in: a-proteobacteria)]|nr:ABC transporter substrate-binding protein [Paracoccus sp. (in: a-proteobacteria)]
MLMGSAVSAANLVYCSEGSPEGFDPALYTSGTSFDASARNIANGLVDFVRGETATEPGLAESWEVSEDGLEYTFHLRPGVKFHTTDYFTPTRDFNADDVIFTFDRQGNADSPYHQMTPGASYEYYNSMSMPELIASIEKIDDLTVKFILTRPEAPMIANLAMPFASIVSKEYADKLIEEGRPEQFNQQPIGTGPFKFVGYQMDAVIRYTRNDDYWQEPAGVENLIFAITPDASVRFQKLRAGECHIMPYPNPADLEAMRADPAINLVSNEGLNVGYLGYNTQMPPFDNPAVRRALNMAIDKQAIVDGIFQGAGSVAKNPIPPTMWSYNNDIVDDPYDPEAARAALAEEGVENLSMKIWAMPVQRPYNPNARRMAEMIQADFAAVGVNAEIVTYEWGEYLERSKDTDRDGAILLGWTGDNGDPDNFLAVLLGCDAVGNANRAQWCNAEFDEIIKKAKVESDQDERTKLYEEAQVVFKREAPWATIAHSVVNEPISTKVEGYKIDPFGGHVFYGVSLTE